MYHWFVEISIEILEFYWFTAAKISFGEICDTRKIGFLKKIFPSGFFDGFSKTNERPVFLKIGSQRSTKTLA